LQALPAVASLKPTTQEAEPRRQCVPRQEPGNERIRGGVQREVSFFQMTPFKSTQRLLQSPHAVAVRFPEGIKK